MSHSLKRVLIMAGGTGGHVFPGLAVADYLRQQGIDVHWLGTEKGLEARVVPEANIPLHLVQIGGVRGKGAKTLLQAPLRISAAIKQSLQTLKQVQPDAVIGMGGFVSGPGGVAAWLQRKPLIIHEQNATAGLTNKMLAVLAKRVLEGFPDAFKAAAKVLPVGNPVRKEFTTMPPPEQRFAGREGRMKLLVIGGSLGAQGLNETLPKALALLPENERPEVWHQCGEKHYDAAKNGYVAAGMNAKLQPFIKDMAEAYAWADIVLCRAGALTVAEVCAIGVGAIFVPFPFAVDDHQTANAQFMVKNNAAACVQQKELTPQHLAAIITDYTRSPAKRLAMARAAYQLRRPEVSKRIFDILCEITEK